MSTDSPSESFDELPAEQINELDQELKKGPYRDNRPGDPEISFSDLTSKRDTPAWDRLSANYREMEDSELLEEFHNNMDATVDDISRNYALIKLVSSEDEDEVREYQKRLEGFLYVENLIHTEPDLTGWDFSNRNLIGADFSGQVLENANFSEAILYGANFSEAILQGATLNNADLRKADFTEADFLGASLFNANFSEADINGAVNLQAANGLEFAIGLQY